MTIWNCIKLLRKDKTATNMGFCASRADGSTIGILFFAVLQLQAIFVGK